ncbi:hypothetical protein JRB95_001384 [Listeria monocytogenes]|nr:hypothetical protein [Listeria monocytogenes]
MTLAEERNRRRKLWKAEYKANVSQIQKERDKNRKEMWMKIKEALMKEGDHDLNHDADQRTVRH